MGNNNSNSSYEDNPEIDSIGDLFVFLLIIIIFIAIYVLYNYLKGRNEKKYDNYKSYNEFNNNEYDYPKINPKFNQDKKNINSFTELKNLSKKKSNKDNINNINDYNNINFINNDENNKKIDLSHSNTGIIKSDINLVEIEQLGFLASQIPIEPKTGLANIGATCYMNATLQCLSHTIKLANYFLDPRNAKLIRSKQFSKELLEVFKKLWIKSYNKNKNDYEPHKFKDIISELNPLFAGIAANDAKDLINFILQELHSELNLANGENNINNDNNAYMKGNLLFQDQTNENQMFMAFFNDFKNNQKSIISDIFFFIIMTKTECLNCKRINMNRGIYNPIYLYNFQIMNFLIFPLETVREYKCYLYNQNFTEVNLNDCFIHYQKVELMQGENQMWCKYCNQNSVSQYMTTIYSPPNILLLILNRGKGNCYNVKLNFTEMLDIGNFVKMKEGKNVIYQLYAIVTHLGPSSMGGHFVAFCRSPIDSKWYKFNDSIVSYEGDNFYNISNFGVPYILFYERQNQ